MKKTTKKTTKHLDESPETPRSQSADPMPSLVFNEVRFEEDENDISPENTLSPHHTQRHTAPKYEHSGLLSTNNPQSPTGSWTTVWLAVGIVMAVFLGIWLYSLPGRLVPTSWKKTDDYRLYSEVEGNWNERMRSSTAEISSIDQTPLQRALDIIRSSTATSSESAVLSNTTSNPGTPTSSFSIRSSTKK